jgi:hypothetical protein
MKLHEPRKMQATNPHCKGKFQENRRFSGRAALRKKPIDAFSALRPCGLEVSMAPRKFTNSANATV